MELRILETSIRKFNNRFELTMMAVARAKQLATGDQALVDSPAGKKPVVLALEELASGALIPSSRKEMEDLHEARRRAREAALAAEREMEAEEEEVPLGTFNPLEFPES